MTMNKIRWTICLAMVTFANFFVFARYVVEAWHFGQLNTLLASTVYLLFALLGCLWLCRQEPWLSALSKNLIWRRLLSQFGRFGLSNFLSAVARMLVPPILSMIICAAGFSAVWNAGLLLGESFDSLNAYAIGERIFKYIPDPWSIKRDRTLATAWYFREHEEDTNGDDCRLDQIVSQVYGPNSLQLGKRYLFAGDCNRRLSMVYFSKRDSVYARKLVADSVAFDERAYQIYRSHSSYAECARLLTMIALCSFTNESHFAHNDGVNKALPGPRVSPECLLIGKAKMAEALAVLPLCMDSGYLRARYQRLGTVCGALPGEQIGEDCSVDSTMYYLSILASMGNDKELADELRSKEVGLYAFAKEPSFRLELALIGISPLLAGAVCLLSLEQILLAGISLSLKRRLSSTADLQAKMVALNKLVALSLFRGNLVEAEHYSVRLLKLAESI